MKFLIYEREVESVREKRKTKENFLSKYLVIYIPVLLLIIGSYYPKIRYFNYSIDTERMIRFPEYTLNWWLKLGRYGLVALSKIPLFGEGVHIRYINILTYFLLFVSVLILSYIFDTNAKRTRIEQFLAIGLYVTTPVILEQTNFVLQSQPVVFSTVLMFLGYGLLKAFVKKKNYALLVLGIILVTLSFTVYVSLVMGFVALTIVELCYRAREESWETKKYFTRVFYFAATCFASYGCYLVGNFICLKTFNLKPSNYLLESRLWGSVPNSQVISTIKSSLVSNFRIDSPFAFWGGALLLLLFIVFSILNKQNTIITIITTVGIIGIGLYTVPLLGYFGTLRSYFPIYPILLYGFAMLIFQFNLKKAFKLASFMFILILISIQAYNTFRFGMNEEKIYQQEVALVNEIESTLTEQHIEDYSKYKLAIIGGRSFEEITHGDMLGNSVFAWDLPSNVGASYRAGDFIYNHGLRFKRITPKDYSKAVGSAGGMTFFPDHKSIKIVDDILIIRLS